MIRLELITVNLLQLVHQHGGPSRPRQNSHSCIFETKENSNLRIFIQYLGHHSKTICRKSAKSMRYRVRPKFEFYRKSLLNDGIGQSWCCLRVFRRDLDKVNGGAYIRGDYNGIGKSSSKQANAVLI